MRINSQEAKRLIQEISEHLLSNYDCIELYPALKFIKKTYRKAPIKIIRKAYNMAYPV